MAESPILLDPPLAPSVAQRRQFRR
ncbi:unnamed protein product, partial [Rotaria magnacalcarata]